MDDRPFGGGEGMLLKAGPIFEAVESIWPERGDGGRKSGSAVGAGPQVRSGAWPGSSAGLSELLLICGRYEGVDERVAEHLADEEISIGDYVLSGGELAAAVVIDAVARLQEGVLGNENSARGRVVRRRRIAGLSAVYAAGGVSRLESAGSAARRQPRGDPASGGGRRRARKRRGCGPDLLEAYGDLRNKDICKTQ